MSLRGISGVVLGYSRIDGGADRAREGRGSLFSDFIRGRSIAFCKIYMKRLHFISYVILSGVRAWISHIYTCRPRARNDPRAPPTS